MIFPHEITRLRAPLVADDYGTPESKRDWDNAAETEMRGFVQPMETTEIADGREASVVRHQLFAPAGSDLLASDRVQYDGDTYELTGDGQSWNMRGLGYVSVVMQKVTG